MITASVVRLLSLHLAAAALLTLPVYAATHQGPTSSPNATRASASPGDSIRAQERLFYAMRHSRKPGEVAVLLKEALETIPGDDWLASIRFSYRFPSEPPRTPQSSRNSCTGSAWWCDMMFMNALHTSRAYQQSEAILARALDTMPDHVRCAWMDVGPLISTGAVRNQYYRASCGDRAALEEKLWWLSDPLYSVPGNERRTEHYSRVVAMRLSSERRTAGAPGWGFALKSLRRAVHLMNVTDAEPREVDDTADARQPGKRVESIHDRAFRGLVYSNPIAFSRMDTLLWERMEHTLRYTTNFRPPLCGTGGRQSFVPNDAALQDPFFVVEQNWDYNRWNCRERMIYGGGNLVPLDHQHAALRRGDSLRLVVVTDLSGDFRFTGTLTSAALAWSPKPSVVHIGQRLSAPRHYAFSPIVPRDSMIVSLEVAVASRWYGRARFGFVPRDRSDGRIDVSDIIFFRPDGAAHDSLTRIEALLPNALGTTRLLVTAPVGLFWEVYGLDAGEVPSIALTVWPDPDRGVVKRPTLPAPPRDTRRETRFSYAGASASGAPIEGMRQVLSIATLRAGHYIMELRVEAGGASAVSTKRFEVVGR